MRAYDVPDWDGGIKLDAMENPHSFPAWLVEQWLGVLRQVSLNRYPSASAKTLKARLAELYGVPDGCSLCLGNGSDELIQMLALTVGGPGRTVLSPAPGFVMYKVLAATTGMDYVGVPLTDDFSLDIDAMLDAIERHRPALVFLAYPNNPTGNLFEREAIERVLDAAPGLVVVDEAYYSFARQSFLSELPKWPNLIVMRTLSKMGLAGLRLGWMAGAPDWLHEVDKTRLPYNIGSLTQASVEFVLDHLPQFEKQSEDILRQRQRLVDAMQQLPGIELFPSSANFLLFRVAAGTADAVHAGLREQGVLIKNLNGHGGVLSDCLRVTAGSATESDAFVAALKRCLA